MPAVLLLVFWQSGFTAPEVDPSSGSSGTSTVKSTSAIATEIATQSAPTLLAANDQQTSSPSDAGKKQPATKTSSTDKTETKKAVSSTDFHNAISAVKDQDIANKTGDSSAPEKAATKKGKDVAVVSTGVVAPNVKLKEVAPVLVPTQANTLTTGSIVLVPDSSDSCQAPEVAALPENHFSPNVDSFVILGAEVSPGTSTRLAWSPGVTISGLEMPTPVLVLHGAEPGPTMCLTAAIHGDEINGIEIVRRVIYDIDPTKLTGKIIGIPIVNLQGFQRGSRYLPDRRDLNRYFPGTPAGSLASRVAYSLFTDVISHCDMLIDFHTGSLRRSNLPQVRANMKNPAVARMTEGFDDMVVVNSPGASGMLRNAATAAGIPAVTLEVGESLRLQANQVEHGAKSVFSLLDREGMYSKSFTWGDPEPVYYKSRWLRAERGGVLLSAVKLGAKVKQGSLLGTVTDPITNESTDIISPVNGRVIGMAVNQVVMHGYAAYHIGVEASEQAVVESAVESPPVDTESEAEYINEEMEPED